MKSEREHLAAGDKRKGASRQTQFRVSVGVTGLAAIAGVAGVIIGSAGLAIPAVAIAAASAGIGGMKYRELNTWGDPEVTVATVAEDGRMLPLTDGAGIALGTTIVGNYRRKSLVEPVPEARLQGWLTAEEKTVRGHGKNKTNYSETVARIPVAVKPNLNDGWFDADFSVQVPVIDVPVTMELGSNEVNWHLSLHVETKGLDDRQSLPLFIAGVVNPAWFFGTPS